MKHTLLKIFVWRCRASQGEVLGMGHGGIQASRAWSCVLPCEMLCEQFLLAEPLLGGSLWSWCSATERAQLSLAGG